MSPGAARAPKFDCPHCGHWDSLVDDTRAREDQHGPYVWRARVCQACGARYETREVVTRVLAYPQHRHA